MEQSIAPQTYIFKLRCPKCQKNVKKLLSGLSGVYSIKIEGEAGRVIVKSKVQPNTLAAILGEAMKGQDYSCEDLPPPPPSPNEQWNNHMPVAGGDAHNQFKGDEIADLHKLAKTQRVKQLEFTQTRNLKMTFNDEKYDGPSQKGSDKGPPLEPKKAAKPNYFGGSPCHSSSALPQEPKKAVGPDDFGDCISALPQEFKEVGGPSHFGVSPPLSAGEGQEVRNLPPLTYNGPYITPFAYHYHHMPSAYHGYFYPPPPYWGHPAALHPPPGKVNCADLSCQNESKCRMM